MDENEIREVIDGMIAALSAGDVKAMQAYYASDVVEYSLAPPLRQLTDAHDPAPVEQWLATFEAPPTREVTALQITVGGDVAFTTSLDCMRAVPKGSTEGFELWFRATRGLRKIDGRWLVRHEHDSVPFEMDGSFRASLDLAP